MIGYLDTSALVKRYVEEAGSAAVRALVRSGERVAISRIAHVEASSAIARRIRQGSVPPGAEDRLRARLAEDLEAFLVVEVTREVIERAARLCAEHPLRAYDAVHLSSAQWLRDEIDPQVRFVCADRSLAGAAEAAGLSFTVPGT